MPWPAPRPGAPDCTADTAPGVSCDGRNDHNQPSGPPSAPVVDHDARREERVAAQPAPAPSEVEENEAQLGHALAKAVLIGVPGAFAVLVAVVSLAVPGNMALFAAALWAAIVGARSSPVTPSSAWRAGAGAPRTGADDEAPGARATVPPAPRGQARRPPVHPVSRLRAAASGERRGASRRPLRGRQGSERDPPAVRAGKEGVPSPDR